MLRRALLAALRMQSDAVRTSVTRHGQLLVTATSAAAQAQLAAAAIRPARGPVAELQLRGPQALLVTPTPEAMVYSVLTERRAHAGRLALRPLGDGRHVMVEFSSPNIAKPFHVGHLRSTILGAYLARLHSLFGFRVTRINYLGDYGKQFGLLGVAADRYGTDGLRTDPLRCLYGLYVQINRDAASDPAVHAQARAFARDITVDPAKLALWRNFRQLSVQAYEQMYQRLGVSFDIYAGESEYVEASNRELQLLRDQGLLVQESNGAMIVDLSAEGCGKAVMRKEDGETVYLARDLAAARHRHCLGFDRLLYVAGSEQKLHFRQLFEMLHLTGQDWHAQCEHVPFGLIRGMRTREGTAVFLDDLLDEARNHMLQIMRQSPNKMASMADPESVAEVLGRSAIVVQDLKARRIKDYTFDLHRMLHHQGMCS